LKENVLKMELTNLDLPQEAINLITSRGLTSLYPPQAKAIEEGLLLGKNIVLAIPTASGKTLVAELAMLKALLEGRGKALYLVPLKALASEKYEQFKEYEQLGLRVIQSTGDFDSQDYSLQHYDLIISTNEKVDSLLRHNVDWIKDIAIIVTDEVHLIDDGSRGPTLEVVLARLKRMIPRTQILALSATISNANEIAKWLDAKLVESTWRPVKLTEGVYYDGTIYFTSGKEQYIKKKNSRYPEIDLVYDTITNGGQALVFATTRRNAMAASERVSSAIYSLLTTEEKSQLALRAQEILSRGEKTGLSERLAKVIRKGAAFHHAGLRPSHRNLIEESFKENLLKCLCATPTLAAGVNLPARRVIIKSLTRYQSGLGNQPIRVLEYKQQAGRAGRPKYDSEGEAIILTRSAKQQYEYLDKYCNGNPEKIYSKLASEQALRTHVLAAIAIGFVEAQKDLRQFIKETFYGHQNEVVTTEFQLKMVVRFLIEEGLVDTDQEFIWATDFGSRVSQLYIDPLSAVRIRDGLRIANATDLELTEVAYFQLLATTPDLRNLYLRKKDQKTLQRYLWNHEEEFLSDIPEEWDPNFESFLMELKTALLLKGWIDEQPENKLLQRFNVGSGDILYITDCAKWLLYAAREIAKLFAFKNTYKKLNELHLRVSHGIKKELVPLVKLKGIGRVRARVLYNAGYKRPEAIKATPDKVLINLPTIGLEIVRSIKEQLESTETQEDLLSF
jgi:helicase